MDTLLFFGPDPLLETPAVQELTFDFAPDMSTEWEVADALFAEAIAYAHEVDYWLRGTFGSAC